MKTAVKVWVGVILSAFAYGLCPNHPAPTILFGTLTFLEGVCNIAMLLGFLKPKGYNLHYGWDCLGYVLILTALCFTSSTLCWIFFALWCIYAVIDIGTNETFRC